MAARKPAVRVAPPVTVSVLPPPASSAAPFARVRLPAARLAPPSRSRSADAPRVTAPPIASVPQSSTSLLIASCEAPPVPTILAKLSLVPPVMVTALLPFGALAAAVPMVVSIQFAAALKKPPYSFTQR